MQYFLFSERFLKSTEKSAPVSVVSQKNESFSFFAKKNTFNCCFFLSKKKQKKDLFFYSLVFC